MLGNTERVGILGFANCDSSLIGEPYPVYDLDDALSTFQGASGIASSLQRGLLETYYAGGRDIVLIPIGTFDEYEAIENNPTSGFYELLDSKYEECLDVIRQLDYLDIVVPYDANPMIDNSLQIFGDFALEVYSDNLTQFFIPLPTGAMSIDLSSYNNPYLVVIGGKALFNFNEVSGHMGTLACTFAGLCSKLSVNLPPDNRQVGSVSTLITDYDGYEEELPSYKVIGFRKTVQYIRGISPIVSTSICRTLANESSDFSDVHTMRVIRRLMRDIQKENLAGSRLVIAQERIKSILSDWLSKRYIYAANAVFKNDTPEILDVDLTIGINSPYEMINVNTKIGPVS